MKTKNTKNQKNSSDFGGSGGPNGSDGASILRVESPIESSVSSCKSDIFPIPDILILSGDAYDVSLFDRDGNCDFNFIDDNEDMDGRGVFWAVNSGNVDSIISSGDVDSVGVCDSFVSSGNVDTVGVSD